MVDKKLGQLKEETQIDFMDEGLLFVLVSIYILLSELWTPII